MTKNIFLMAITLLSFTIATITFVIYNFSPVDPEAPAIIVEISPGESSKSIGQKLTNKNLLRNSATFELMARASGKSRELKAGSYRLSPSMSVPQLIELLSNGEVITKNFVVPEGLTIKQIAKLWENNGFGSAETFVQETKDIRLRLKFSIDSDSIEGYLFPDTYQMIDGTPPKKMIEIMLQQSDRRWRNIFSEKLKNSKLTRAEIITLASIIEKEAKVAKERPIISGVYHNRLRKGWRLYADPTVLYGLGNPDRPLTRKDLRTNTLYNTYLHKGLPPSPICNPGEASILAALEPEKVPYFYFVAIGNGEHYFSVHLREHEQMVSKFQRNR